MGYHEKKMFRRTSKPVLCFRDPDETFAIFNEEYDCDSFLSAMNSLHPCLAFTFEKETHGKLLFLDLLLVNVDSKFLMSIYTLESFWSPKTEDESYWNPIAPGSVYLRQTQTTIRAEQHPNYSSQKWLPRQCYLARYVQGYH